MATGHDPDDEVTVISAEGVGRGVLKGNTIEMVTDPLQAEMEKRTRMTVDLTPSPAAIDNIINFLRAMSREGVKQAATANKIIREGWPQLTPLQARLILDGTKTLTEMLEVAKANYTLLK